MTGSPSQAMIRIRDLRVWYPLRKGLLGELFGRSSKWVRAVDSVSFDIRNGEVLCLVGESGCGKTSTGRAILQLAPATGGDIFIEVPDREFEAFQEASRGDGPESAGLVDEIRRKYSITWKETLRWSTANVLSLVGMIAVAVLLAWVVPSALVGFLSDPFTNTWVTIGSSLLIGAVLGLAGTLPPAPPWRRLPLVLAGLSAVAAVFSGVPAFYFRGLAGIEGVDASAWALSWERDLFGMLLSAGFAPMAAGSTSTLLLDHRQRREGHGGIRMRTLRRRLQLIFQDPYESLNPKQSVYEIVAEPLHVNRITRHPEETTTLVVGALRDAGLRPPEEFLFRFPHELSGGQRQRVSIAAALVLQPDFIVADEPVSMLDVSIRTGILQLMMDLRKSRGLTYLFITHDLGLAWIIADRIAVMYLGKIVELGTAEQVIRSPKHPYTRALISVVPSPDPRQKIDRIILRGERPDPVDIPPGCRFHPRCPFAFERCGWTATEVAERLRSLKGAGLLDAARIESSEDGTVRVTPRGNPSDVLASQLAALLEGRRETDLPLKGIARIQTMGDSIVLTLHASSEPPLREIERGNFVACHLVTPPETIPESITA